jgi:flavoprotein hydroxylase
MGAVRDPVDVAIVGYGPVGQVLAILLGQRGWRVSVLERWPSPYPLPRAVHFDHEVGRILQSAGVAGALAGKTEPAPIYEWRNAAGKTLLRFGRDAGGGLCGWPESNMFCQPELERILAERALSLPNVAVARGCEVVGALTADEGVELRARRAGDETTVRARFAVGCDGANSFVRGALGAAWTDLGFQFDWLIVDLIPREARSWDPLNWQLCDPARPTTVVSGGPGRRRFEFMRLPGESAEELNSERTAWRLLEPWSLRPDNAVLERHALYTFGARWADRWRSGRLLLAGDAAHLMPPFAGQGMCSGLRDAANLAWKLDLVLAGRAPESLLDSYPSERLPQVRQVIDFSMALGRVICIADPTEAAARDEQMGAAARSGRTTLPAPLPPPGSGVFLDGDANARRLCLQGRVRRGGKSGLFDDVVGGGFVLLGAGCDPVRELPPELASLFASLGGRGAWIGGGGDVDDLDGSYARWFKETGAAVALQRPDFYVFGTAPEPEGAAALVAELRRQLGAR